MKINLKIEFWTRNETNESKLTKRTLLFRKKQSKSAKLCANIKWKLKGKKCSKTFFKALEKHNIQNQTISELYIDDNQSKHSRNPTDILKSAKNFY